MSYLPKIVVEKNIKQRVRKDRLGREHTDYEAYFGTDPFTKSAVRKTRSSLEELEKDIKDFYLRHSAGGDAAVRLTAMQAIDAKNALDELCKAKVSISLTEAVRAFLEGSTRVLSGNLTITVGRAAKEFYDSKPDGEHKNKINATVLRWTKDYGEDKTLASVTAKDVFDYLEANFKTKTVKNKKTGKKSTKALKPKTYNSHLLYLKTFFNWCREDERKYLVESPIKGLKYRPEPWEEPQYMKPADVERLFRMLEGVKDERPDMLAYAIINFFCGSRGVEIVRAGVQDDAAKINIEDETVRISKGKGYQRGRRPRAFHIDPTALAWMKSFDFLGGVKRIVKKKTQCDMYKLARKNGIPVFQNCGRHTYITMDVAAYGDPAKTQAKVGTSAKMRAENYCGLASKAEGEAFFKIMPKPSKLDGLEY